MTERITETEIQFTHPFFLNALTRPLAAGTYRLTVVEELIEGLSFAAYRKIDARLEVPAVDIPTGKRQYLQVTAGEIETAHTKDMNEGVAP